MKTKTLTVTLSHRQAATVERLASLAHISAADLLAALAMDRLAMNPVVGFDGGNCSSDDPATYCACVRAWYVLNREVPDIRHDWLDAWPNPAPVSANALDAYADADESRTVPLQRLQAEQLEREIRKKLQG
jgi:hypothetical protein